MRLPILLAAALLSGCLLEPNTPPVRDPDAQTTPASPYADEDARAIKALSAEEVEGYLAGAGLGYAKPAELNSYPGPLHALEMSERLGLSEDQRMELRKAREDMLAKAIPLGERYVAIEVGIERHFREGTIDADTLATLLAQSAEVERDLRYAHLEAHLATKALLTPHQIALYDEARGYGAADHASHEHNG